MSDKFLKYLIAFIALAILLLSPQAVKADAIVSPRVFTRGSFVYVVEPQRVVFLSMDTRSSHTLYIAEDEHFTIVSAVRSDDVIWISNNMGAVIALNMQTGGIEEFGRGLAGEGGQLDVDRRFLWVASSDTLHRMDLTSREWVALSIPGNDISVRGIITFNDQVHIIAADAVYILNAVSEDWVVVPHRDFVLKDGDFYKINEMILFTQERTVYRYDPSKRYWNKITVGARIRKVNFEPGRFAVTTENRMYHINPSYFVLEAQPMLPVQRNPRAITSHSGRTVCVLDRGIAIYNSPFNFDIATYPNYINISGDIFAFSHYNHIMLYNGDNFIIYNHDRKLWSGVRILNRNKERKEQYMWDENGAYINLTDEYQSVLSGTATAKLLPNAGHNDAGDFEIDMGLLATNGAINVRTEDPSGRFLDLTADNSSAIAAPQRGIYYKGIDSDLFDRFSFGTQGTGLTPGRVTHDVVTEGALAVFSSNAKTEGRDRSVMTATAGAGHVLSRMEWRSYGYSQSATYFVHEVEWKEIIPSSVKLYVDGIPLPESDYFYDPHSSYSGAVRLLRRDKAEPTSLIQISYSARILSGEPSIFEIFPENHIGRYGFFEGTISPRSWMSARMGFMARDNDEIGSMIFAGLPVELRDGANRSFLMHPEIAYDNKMGMHSASITMGARENKAFASYKGLWAGEDFYGLNHHYHDYRKLNDEHEVNIGYDVLDNLRASWYQLHRRVDGSDLSHFELRSSYIGNGFAPDVEMSVSSGIWNHHGLSSRSHKETFSLRLSDLSSRILGDMNRLHNVGYDISWTEYQNRPPTGNLVQHGRTVYGTATVSPISSLTFAGSGMYRLNPQDYHVNAEINPSLSVYTRDLPRGFDIGATYSTYILDLRNGWDNVGVGRNFFAFFYPGEYLKALERFAIYLGLVNEMESYAPPTMSPLKYVFMRDENTHKTQTIEEFGFLYFPTDNILISSINSIFNDRISPVSYSTGERIKMWLENGHSVEANLQIGGSTERSSIHSNAFYEHRWENGLMTGAGLFGSYNSNANESSLYCGPMIIVSQTKDLSGFIRSVEHSHHFRMAVNRDDIPKPSIDYAPYLRLKMNPNMSLEAHMGVSVQNLDIINGSGGMYLHVGF